MHPLALLGLGAAGLWLYSNWKKSPPPAPSPYLPTNTQPPQPAPYVPPFPPQPAPPSNEPGDVPVVNPVDVSPYGPHYESVNNNGPQKQADGSYGPGYEVAPVDTSQQQGGGGSAQAQSDSNYHDETFSV